jgi:hypothetical protein
MKYTAYLWSAVIVCVVLIAVLFWKVYTLDGQFRNLAASGGGTLQESLTRMQADIKAAKELAPGLGDYMSTIQLHAGKLWFAATAANWELAEYELDELKETMEAAKRLNVEKNSVKISGVLDSVLQTQVAQLAESIKRKNENRISKIL